MALDFSLLGQGPQFGNVLAAYDAGREQRKRTDTTNALALYATDPEKGISALTKVDPLLGLKLQDDYTERQALKAKKEIFANPDPKARAAAAQASGDPQVIEAVAKMDERQRAQAKELTDALGGFAFGLRKKPYEERKAILQAAAPDFEKLGFPADKIASIDPTDAYLDAQIGEAQTLAQQIEQANKDREFKSAEENRLRDDKRAEETAAEARRHNQASEGISAFSARDASARGWANVGVARAAEARQERAASQPNAGKPPTEDQAKTGFNAQRMIGASQTLNGLEAKGFNPTMVGIGSALARPESRQYDAAKREWSDGIIRLTTGAAATKQELEAVDKAYFPQFGDSPAVVRYKAQRRKAAEDSAAARAAGQRQTPPSDGGYKVLKVR